MNFLSSKTIRISIAALLLFYLIIVAQPWNLYFLNDDFVHIPLSAETIWVHFYFFRPVANLLTALEVAIYGKNPLGFHITSIILHIITTCCVTLLTDRLLNTYGKPGNYAHAGFITGCLFFIYPFHSEPLLWIIGRISIIATFFLVLSVYFFLKRSRWYNYLLSLLFFIPGLFTYEIAWILPLLITILSVTDYYKFKISLQKTIFHIIPFWVIFGIYLFTRSIMLQGLFTEYESGRDLSVTTLLANYFRLFARTVIPPVRNTEYFIIAFVAVITLLLILAFLLVKNKRIKPVHILAGSFLAISYIPTVTLGIDTHGSEGERYLYLPSIFFILLLVLLLYELPAKRRLPVTLLLLCFYSFMLAKSATNYRHASRVAKNILTTLKPSIRVHKIIAINLPANYRGAMIFRSGFKQAVKWMHPGIKYDSVIVFAAKRTYQKIPGRLKEVTGNTLQQTGLDTRLIKDGEYIISYNNQPIAYNSKTDMLLYFKQNEPGIVIYPEP